MISPGLSNSAQHCWLDFAKFRRNFIDQCPKLIKVEVDIWAEEGGNYFKLGTISWRKWHSIWDLQNNIVNADTEGKAIPGGVETNTGEAETQRVLGVVATN